MTGLQQSLWSGIYSPSVGFTLAFGDSVKELVAFSGMSMSVGSILGQYMKLKLYINFLFTRVGIKKKLPIIINNSLKY